MNTKQSGIYAIINTVNGKRYIGSACNIAYRWTEHRKLLRKGSHQNSYFQAAWNKYGDAAFVFTILSLCPIQQLISTEQTAIDLYDSANCDCGYNLSPTAGSSLGVKHTTQARANMSAARKGLKPWNVGVPMSLEQKQAISDRQRGRKQSPELIEKRAAKLRGRKQSPEHLASRMAALRSPESRANISAAMKGRTLSPEHVVKVAAANRGLKRSVEACQRMSASARARSPESRANIAIAAKARMADPVARARISATLKGRRLSESHVLNMARGHALFTSEQAEEIRKLRQEGWTRRRLAEHFCCSDSTIKSIIYSSRGHLVYAVPKSLTFV